MAPYVFGSLTRISNLEKVPFSIGPLPRDRWEWGDYVVGRVTQAGIGKTARIEHPTGRMSQILKNDLIVGALGTRQATLEAVGDWKAIEDDLQMDSLTSAGLFGKCTSISPELSPLAQLLYIGHVWTAGKKATMTDCVPIVPAQPFDLPVIMIVGTSMSSGKTTSGRIVVKLLKEMGLTVVAAKITGAGRYRDVLSMGDAGADFIFDFVDVGLPSTICSPERFKKATSQLLSRMAAVDAQVALIEAGASPLEPYNGAATMEMLRHNLRCMVLCASDPYAVAGVMTAFKYRPDLVSGIASNTSAGIALIKKLTGVPALNLLQEESRVPLRALLEEKLALITQSN